MAPVLSDVGAVMVGAAAPKTTLAALKPRPDKVGVALVTVNAVVLVALA